MMPSTSVAPTPINTFFQVFIAKVSRLSAYDRSCRVLVIERRKRTVVAHEQLRSDERESSLVRAKQVFPSVAPVGLRKGDPQRKSLYRGESAAGSLKKRSSL